MMIFRRQSLSRMPPSPKHWDVRKKRGDNGADNLRVASDPEVTERIVSFLFADQR
jgi:hypothetical protein